MKPRSQHANSLKVIVGQQAAKLEKLAAKDNASATHALARIAKKTSIAIPQQVIVCRLVSILIVLVVATLVHAPMTSARGWSVNPVTHATRRTALAKNLSAGESPVSFTKCAEKGNAP